MLPYLDQVMVLQDFGQDKKAQEDLVKKVNAGFDRMKQAIADGKMGQYKTQNDIQKAFGPPIILEHVVEEGKIYVQALYRYAIQKNSPGKVHIYYDARGNVVKWESLP
jgi:hypothetical protein